MQSQPSFFAKPYAAIEIHSLGISYPRWTRENLSRPYERYGSGITLDYNQVSWADLCAEEQRAFLVDNHELDHFAMLISTPVGVLLWRLYQVIARDVLYVAEVYAEAGIPLEAEKFCSVGQGLPEWFQESGEARLRLLSHKLKRGSPHVDYVKGEVIVGLEACLKLTDILTCDSPIASYPTLTSGEFSKLLNATFSYLARRCHVELDCYPTAGIRESIFDYKWNATWYSINPNERMFRGPSDMNVRSIMELMAYCKERRIVRAMGGSSRDFDYWREDRVPSQYHEQLNFWLEAARHSQTMAGKAAPETIARNAMIESLLGRVDITSIGKCDQWDPHGPGNDGIDKVYEELKQGTEYTGDGRIALPVEAEWPWFRCQRIRQKFDMCCLPTIRPVLTLGAIASRQKLWGPMAKWDEIPDPTLQGLAASGESEGVNLMGVHLRKTNDALIAGNAARFDSLQQALLGDGPNLSSEMLTKHLLLVEYKDELSFFQGDGLNLHELLSAVYFGAKTSILFSVAVGSTPPDPSTIRSKVEGFVSRLGELDPDKDSQFADLGKRLARQLFSKDAFSRSANMTLW